MAFDPNLPQENTLADAVQMRAQLNGLKTIIDAIPAGPAGPEWPPGPPGQPGGVTTASLDAAIAGTARNPDTVAPLALTVSDPPTQAEMQQVVDKLNELIAALPRPPV